MPLMQELDRARSTPYQVQRIRRQYSQASYPKQLKGTPITAKGFPSVSPA